jgi:nicotinate-nucleotide adenylyltransferase
MPRAIGILGGTFDPVHVGHLIAASWALDELALEQILLVPNHQPPLKRSAPAASFADRLAMLMRAVDGASCITVSDIEGRRGGVSYTIETLSQVQGQYPDAELSLILGSDALADFALWREHERIAGMARIVAIVRGAREAPLPPVVRRVLTMPRIDISSSLIRQRVAAGQSIAFLTPASVVAYIRDHRLYGSI